MGAMKRFAEDVSVDMGYGGEINDHVLKEAQERLERQIEQAQHEVELQHDRETDEYEAAQRRDSEDS